MCCLIIRHCQNSGDYSTSIHTLWNIKRVKSRLLGAHENEVIEILHEDANKRTMRMLIKEP